MTESKIGRFLFEGESAVRVVYRDGVPWFVTADVCRALGITNASQAIDSLDEDEKDISLLYALGGEQEMLVVSEGGLYTLILRCRDAVKKGTLPHRFRRWVTSEVLPAVRADALPMLPQPPMPEVLKVRLVAEARQTFGTRASAELWFALSLPTVVAMHPPNAQGDLFYLRSKDIGSSYLTL